MNRRACLAACALAAPALLLGPAWGQGLPREKDLRIFVMREALLFGVVLGLALGNRDPSVGGERAHRGERG